MLPPPGPVSARRGRDAGATLRSVPQHSSSPERLAPPRPATAAHRGDGAASGEDAERPSAPAQRPDSAWPPRAGTRRVLGPAPGRSLALRPGAVQGALRVPQSARYKRERQQSIADACPMECPVQGHAGHPSDRVKHVSARLQPLLPAGGVVGGTQYSAHQFRVFGANSMVAWTAVQLCDVVSGHDSTTLRAAAVWGLGSLVCELTDLQNFIGGSMIAEQIFADAAGVGHTDAALQSCAAFAVACLARFNTKLQLRAASKQDLVLKIGAILQESTSPAVLYSNLQAVGNICYNNLRAQQQFASDGILGTVDALCHARDTRIRNTACRCRDTFLLLLSRGPDSRVSISQQAPFDRRGSGASTATDASDAPTIPSSPQDRREKLELVSPIRARRPTTALPGSRTHGISPRPESARIVTCLPPSEQYGGGERGWIPVSPNWNPQSPQLRSQGSLAEPLQIACTKSPNACAKSPNEHQLRAAAPSSSSPIMNVRRMKTGSTRLQMCHKPGADICVSWSTSPHTEESAVQSTIRKASFEQAEDALDRMTPLKTSMPDFFGPKQDVSRFQRARRNF